MNFIHASALSLFAFDAILAFVVTAFLVAIYLSSPQEKRIPKTVLSATAIAAWLGVVALLVQSDLLQAAPMPRLFIFMGLSNLFAVGLALSPLGKQIARRTPIAYLVAFQGFRLPLELVLHAWAEQGVIPTTMTWTGMNFDIVSGILAVICAPLSTKYRAAAWVANLAGFTLLFNVGRVAVMSSPLPFAWQATPPLLLAFYLPYAFIVPVCVAGALAGHIVLTRALLTRR